MEDPVKQIDLLLTSGLLTLGACSTTPQRAPQIAKAEPVASVSELIAEARCTREARCNNVGIDRRYSSMEDCRARIWTEWNDDLDARQCEDGVNEAELDKCLTEITVLECSSRLDSLEQLAACNPELICSD